jgi:hypothetical protein
MAGSTPPKKDAQEERAYQQYELNLEMWRHYDNLRQEKSKTFLTAQTILIAVSGFVLQSQGLSPALRVLLFAVAVLGLVSSFLWFGLLSRNKGYIDFHRARVKELEPHTGMLFPTFCNQRPRGMSSNTIDRVLAIVFALFWLCFCVVGVLLFYTPRVFG